MFHSERFMGHRPIYEKHYKKNLYFNEGTRIVVCPKIGIFFTRKQLDNSHTGGHKSNLISTFILKDDDMAEDRIKDMEFFCGKECLFRDQHLALEDMP